MSRAAVAGGPGRAAPVAAAFAEHWPTLVARLARRYGDLALAEDAAADAFAEAARAWPLTAPRNPGGWLWTTAQRRAVDRLRQAGSAARRARRLAEAPEASPDGSTSAEGDQLALLFGCCHPSLAPEAQVALTLRAVNGLSTQQIATLFLTRTDTMTRRLSRARTKLAANAVPFAIPEPEHWSERLAPVLEAIYLTFTSGHTSGHTSGDQASTLIRGDACDEARWLITLVARVAPTDPELLGLASLMAFADARRPARVDPEGRLVLMADQDRTLWDRTQIAQGRDHLRRALRQRRLGTFQIEAALSACHAMAPSWEETDWDRILRWYDALLAVHPSDVNRLNRSVALAMAGRPAESLVEIDSLVPDLAGFHYLWVARAEALERLGRPAEAAEDVQRALDLQPHPVQVAELRLRLERLRSSCADPPAGLRP